MADGSQGGSATGSDDIVVVTEKGSAALTLGPQLAGLNRRMTFVHAKVDMVSLPPCSLLVWQGNPDAISPSALFQRLAPEASAVLILPQLHGRWVAQFLCYPQVRAFFTDPADKVDLKRVVGHLGAGDIPTLEQLLPADRTIHTQQVGSYDERCQVLDRMTRYLKDKRVRGKLRRTASLVAEELLVNTMYLLSADERGDLSAEAEFRSKSLTTTPRPVTARYAVHEGSFFISVRDSYGDFARSDLAAQLLRRPDRDPDEEPQRAPGFGLFQVIAMATRLIVNISPGSSTEFICEVDSKEQGGALKVLWVNTFGEAAARDHGSGPHHRPSMSLTSVLSGFREILDALSAGVGEKPGRDTIADWKNVEDRRTLVNWPARQDTIVEWPPMEVEMVAELPDAPVADAPSFEAPTTALPAPPLARPPRQAGEPRTIRRTPRARRRKQRARGRRRGRPGRRPRLQRRNGRRSTPALRGRTSRPGG
jgi:hypothetical protein